MRVFFWNIFQKSFQDLHLDMGALALDNQVTALIHFSVDVGVEH